MPKPLTQPSELHRQREALRRSLAELESAGMSKTVLDPLRQQLNQIELQIQTAGGAVVAGDVKTGGGTFVGRDQILAALGNGSVILGGDATGLTIVTGDGNIITLPPDQVPPEILLQVYYRSLANECCRLPLGVVDPQFIRPLSKSDVSLSDVYVDLDVVSPPPIEEKDKDHWGLRAARGEGRERTPLLEAVAHPKSNNVVLLGDAGSGKTTFVNYLAYLLSTNPEAAPEALRGRLPVRLVLRQVAARHIPAGAAQGRAGMIWDALKDDIAARLGEAAAGRLYAYLHGRLLREGGLIMLDGLDEVPQARRRRKALLEAIRDLVGTLPAEKSRFIVTARPYAYADSEWQLPDFHILALAPFSQEQAERFIQRWYQGMRPVLGWNEETARDKGGVLLLALRERSYLADLAQRPLLLTLMATLHSSWGQLPEDRANLYEETVKLLLGRWQRAREVKGSDGEPVVEPGIVQTLGAGEERIRSALEALAFAAHTQQAGEPERSDAPADISEGDVLVAFKPLLGKLDPDVLLDYLQERAGLLVARRDALYAFPHRSFQEYLAACHLANTEPDFAQKLRNLVWDDSSWWREVFLLGVGKKRQGGLGDAVNVINILVPLEPGAIYELTEPHWQAAALAGQALVDLRLHEKAATQPHFEAILDRVRRWLVTLVEGGHLAARERADAGDALGQLGDPRFDSALCFLPYLGEREPFCGFVEIPKGPFVMGSSKGDEGADDDEFGNPKSMDIPYSYWMARYPTTVAQFQAFVQAKGYDDPGLWTKTGWAWRGGQWDSQVEDELMRDVMKRRSAEARDRPLWWDEQHAYFNRPVMGVSWFEAMAYCRWLDARVRASAAFPVPEGCVLRLPTEAEWEKAARFCR